MKILEQLLLQFLLLIVNIYSCVFVSAPNSIGLLQRSSWRFKEFSLGCLVVGFSYLKKKKKDKFTDMVTQCHSLSLVVSLVVILCLSLSFLVTLVNRCYSLLFVVTRCTTRCHSLSLVVPLVVTRYTTRLSFYKRSFKFHWIEF